MLKHVKERLLLCEGVIFEVRVRYLQANIKLFCNQFMDLKYERFLASSTVR